MSNIQIMELNWHEVSQRLAAKDAAGHFLPAYTGSETDEELHEIMVAMIENCRKNADISHCVFRLLKIIPNYTMKDMVHQIKRQTCLELLNEECACRNRHDCLLPLKNPHCQ